MNSESGVRYVFLLRHGDSQWNVPQRDGDISGLLKEYDNGLSEIGRAQAESLRSSLANAKIQLRNGHVHASMKPWLEQLLTPDVVYTSPFTRAIQTAIIALEDVLEHTGPLKVNRLLREVRSDGFHGFSSSFMGDDLRDRVQRELELVSGKVVGEQLRDRVQRELEELVSGKGSWVETAQKRLDLTDVQEKWWADTPDSEEAIALQLRSLVDELQSQASGSSAVLVGHSNLFRQLLRTYISHADVPSDVAASATSQSIANCGILGVKLCKGSIIDVMPMPELPLHPTKVPTTIWRAIQSARAPMAIFEPAGGYVPETRNSSLPTLLGSVGERKGSGKAEVESAARTLVGTKKSSLPTLLGSIGGDRSRMDDDDDETLSIVSASSINTVSSSSSSSRCGSIDGKF